MPGASFFDSNVMLYLATTETEKATRVEHLIRDRGKVSVQVMNEVTNVARRKLELPWADTRHLLETIRLAVTVVPVTLAVHQRGIALAERYKLAIYGSFIVAAALESDCDQLWSEDMHDGLVIDSRLTIRNPFAAPASP